MPEVFEITAKVSLPEDMFDRADVIANVRNPVDAFVQAIKEAAGEENVTVTSGIPKVRATRRSKANGHVDTASTGAKPAKSVKAKKGASVPDSFSTP